MSSNSSSFFYSSGGSQQPLKHTDLFDTTSDVNVPSLQDFETDLDLLGGLPDDNASLQQLFNTNPDLYGPIRSAQPAVLSDYDAQTVSSVTASSWYSAAQPQSYQYPAYSPALPAQSNFPYIDPLGMEFQNVRIDMPTDYGHSHAHALAYAAHQQQQQHRHAQQQLAYARIQPSPPHSPHHNAHHHAVHRARSEYQPAIPRHMPRIQSSSSSYSPEHHSTRLPTIPHVPAILSVEDGGEMGHLDSRRKHQCPNCPRAFARAFNLKTHMETHNPNRAKPYVCPHPSCARSFSRKHDLQRHRAAIHHDQSSASSVSPPSASAPLPSSSQASSPSGTTGAVVKAEPAPAPRLSSHSPAGSISSLSAASQRGPKGWCNGCGSTWVGDNKTCECKS